MRDPPCAAATSSFGTAVGVVRDYFGAKGRDAAAKFFRGNSQTAHGWKPR